MLADQIDRQNRGARLNRTLEPGPGVTDDEIMDRLIAQAKTMLLELGKATPDSDYMKGMLNILRTQLEAIRCHATAWARRGAF